MHLYVFIRAIKHDLDRFISDLEAQYFNFTYVKDGKFINGAIQMSVRSWGGFYELAFPEECLNEVLTMLSPLDDYDKTRFGIGLMFYRKALGAKKLNLKKFEPLKYKRPTWKSTHPDIRVVVIGTKKDKRDIYGVELI